ncbi:MAG: glycosyltransferase family 39 protein [Thermodesulfobacteriota bacterium]
MTAGELREEPRRARTPLALGDAGWILGCGLLLALVLRPFQDAPFVDDWVYAWSVEQLLAGRGLVILEWSAHPNFAQVLWGALLAWPVGFSFVALRVSTWVAALLALCALQLLLRELGVARRDAFLGTALVAANPVFVMLAATFMTDVPLVAALLWAALAFVVALRRRSDGWLAAFVVLACVASAVRVVAVAAPIAAVATLALHGGPWGRRPARLVAAAAPLAFLAVLLAWTDARAVHVADLSHVVGSPTFRRRWLLETLIGRPELVLQAVLFAAGSVGLALLPLAAAIVDRAVLRRALPVACALGLAVVLARATGVDWPPPLAPTFTWTWTELGASESLVAPKPDHVAPAWATASATGAAFVSFALVMALVLRRLRPEEAFLAWAAAGQLGLIAILWLFYDRYMLPLLPLLVALALAARPRLRPRVAVALLAAFALVGALGLRDHLAYSGALWEAVARLRARGVPDAEIDGGYVVNGWLHFVREPGKQPRDAAGRVVFPWITEAAGVLPYQLTNRPLPGWTVLDSVPYERWLGRSGAIYVLERAQRPARGA